MLFVCLFLPSYEGCNGQPVHVYEVLARDGLSSDDIYFRFILAWPFILGLVISIGTLLLVWSGKPRRARFLWWCFAVLILRNAGFLLLAFANDQSTGEEFVMSEWKDLWFAVCWFGTAVILLVLLPITRLCCRNWFTAAMWLQLSLTLTAAVCLSCVVPSLVFADRLLMGGKLAIACSVLLIVTTIVQQLDGHRALTRSCGESPLQLSLKWMLLLMQVAGMACAWVGAYVFIDLR